MIVITRPAATILLLLIALTASTSAQQKRQTTPKAAPAATPAPTFDTLLPADSYAIYGEVRGAGQLIRSNTVNELLEPVLKLAGPPKELKSIVKWLNAHAEQVMSSRLLVATWPMKKNLPETILAIEFASAEEAAKFAIPLNEFLPTVLPAAEPSPKAKDETEKSAATEKSKATTPPFYLQRLGSLVVISPKPWTIKQLKPAGSRLLAEDANFRTARNRFTSEPIFVFVDIKSLERQEEEQRKRAEESAREQAEQAKREQAAAEQEVKKAENSEADKRTTEEKAADLEAVAQLQAPSSDKTTKEPPPPDPILNALSNLGSSFFGGQSDWPDAIGLALSFEGESFDLHALFINPPGEKSDVVPFMPNLIPGPAYAPESPNIFPADTELFVTMSLDLPQIYSEMSKPRPASEVTSSRGEMVSVNRVEFESPFAEIEKRLKINLRDDLLPLLGPEVAIRLPMTGMGIAGMSGVILSNPGATDDSSGGGPALAIGVRDKEALRALMPKLIDALGFKGASSFAQTERREDTELVSYAKLFSYAFVGNFIVFSANPATTRQIVDSYLKHETLSGNSQFKNHTRWQPRQLHGEVYVSPALMESYKTWAEQPSSGPSPLVSERGRAFLARLSLVPQPITYALSNEGLGPLHELHIPKNLVLMAVAGISGEFNAPPTVQNERMAIGSMYRIANAEHEYKTSHGNGNCGTLDQLIAANLLPKDFTENSGYRFDVTVSGDKFEVTAAPTEYGKTGKLSLFMDETFVLRGSDHNGASASAADPPIH
jgi:hypothetical protein